MKGSNLRVKNAKNRYCSMGYPNLLCNFAIPMNTIELQKVKQRYNIVGNCDALNRALDVALQVAPTDLSVLIIGESGVGS